MVISSTNVFVHENYTLGGLPAGTYTISILLAIGFETKTERGVQVTEGGTTVLDFSLTPSPGGREKRIQVTLGPANGMVNEPVSLIAIAPGRNFYYKFWYTANDYCGAATRTWAVGKDWTTNNTFIWTPSRAGEYILVVWFNDEPSDPTCVRQMGTTYWVLDQ